MSVVDPIFGRTAVNAASSCGCEYDGELSDKL